MSIKKGTCGIYSITTPKGSTYVGSSVCIERRFCEHKSMLRRGKHHSSRLQKAYAVHGESLKYSIIHVCESGDLVTCEQEFINKLNACLNVATEVNNVWANPETRKKFEDRYKTEEFKKQRSLIASNISTRWRPVECSDGTIYKNLTDAANAFRVRAAHIAAMIKSGQKGTKITVRFKYKDDEWPCEMSRTAQLKRTRLKNGTDKMSDQARLKMSLAKKGKPPSPQAVSASVIKSSIAVDGVSIKTGKMVCYASSMEAGRVHGNGVVRTAASQINKCIKGVKKTAYGYKWSYHVA